MKTFLLVAAIVALLGPVAAWAEQAVMRANGHLMLVATDSAAADAAAERERIFRRIQRLRRIQRQPLPAPPYGTGFEVRKEMSTESAPATPDRLEWPERMERTQRPGRLDRPAGSGGRRAGR